MHSVSTQVEFGVCCSPFLGACVDLFVAERSLLIFRADDGGILKAREQMLVGGFVINDPISRL